MDRKERTAVIIGAGPAGLTAAYELLERTDVRPVVFEMSPWIGGISKTLIHEGNRIDIGGHRFFSRSGRVMDWWLKILPQQGAPSRDDRMLGRPVDLSPSAGAPDPEKTNAVMLVRNRLSRIFFLKKFFDYPLSLSFATLANLGPVRTVKILSSYLRVRLSPIREEKSLEDFFINRFGRELYETFFRDYTEKVWGMQCREIGPEWGAQRVKGLSVTKVLLHALKSIGARAGGVAQKGVETSLIDRFFYPKLGPGQMWENVARIVESRGGEIRLRHKVTGMRLRGGRVESVTVTDLESGRSTTVGGAIFISTMPIRDLIGGLDGDVPAEVRETAMALQYRDFVSVGLLARKMKIRNATGVPTVNDIVPDNWIYIQEKDVRLGRLQIFNNWSPYLVRDAGTVWLGLEYFCNEGDDLWRLSDPAFADLAIRELCQIGFIDREDVMDTVVIREAKAYPAYFGAYGSFHVIREFTDTIGNLYLVGRNGMHRYNNQDHSMLSAMAAVDNIAAGNPAKDNIWAVNTEQEYHEGRLTAIENLSDELLAKIARDDFDYNPDIYWDKTKDVYPHYPSVRHRRRFILSRARKSVAPSGEFFVFDYGCGEGTLLREIRDRLALSDAQLGGCDISNHAVEAARRKIGSPFLFAEPFPRLDRKCDLVVCCEVIEHTTDYLHILSWIVNNLKPGGTLILTTQSGRIHPSDLYTAHTQHFDIRSLSALLRKIGFEIVRSSLWGFPFFTLQKYLTNIRFESVRESFMEGEPTRAKMAVFGAAHLAFFVHDVIPFGPQIYIVAKKPKEKR